MAAHNNGAAGGQIHRCFLDDKSANTALVGQGLRGRYTREISLTRVLYDHPKPDSGFPISLPRSESREEYDYTV